MLFFLDYGTSSVTRPSDAISPRKPLGPRRASSRIMPHRGQEFSVDDAEQEIPPPRLLRSMSGTMRRQPSTLRRRTTAQTRLAIIESPPSDAEESGKDDGQQEETLIDNQGAQVASPEEEEPSPVEEQDDEEEGDKDLSDAESFTLKDRQEAINSTHPFGIRIWKPALYKKGRSVQKDADGDVHSSPGLGVSRWLILSNFGWTILFGWWLALVAAVGSLLCNLLGFASGSQEYGRVLWGLARYLFYPFGKYVKLIQDEAYAEEDEGEGRSITEYEQWQSGDIEEGRLFFGPVATIVGRRRESVASEEETASLLGRTSRNRSRAVSISKPKRRLFGRGQWTFSRIIFFVFFYGLLTPLFFFVSGITYLLVFTIPMGKVLMLLFHHLRRHPLALEFHADTTYTRGLGAAPSSILLCTYRAVGVKYWKYTIDGTNIFLINLLGIVAFVIFDYWVLYVGLGMRIALTNTIFVFLLALFSIIPLAYFIGQAVASISAQSTMGVGAAINAFFSTIVEVFLYCVALRQGKAALVEGSIIGSIFAGILLLPGVSMCFGAIKRKTQRFNVKSAGVTSTMLLFATIGVFGPTLFYQIYGSVSGHIHYKLTASFDTTQHKLNCHNCHNHTADGSDRNCQRCYFAQTPALNDPFYENAVRPFTWFAAVLLFLSYVIGLLFTLRTHAATIWNSEFDEKRERIEAATAHHNMNTSGAPFAKTPSVDYGSMTLSRQNTNGTYPRNDVRDTQLYKRILGQSLRQAGISSQGTDGHIEALQSSSDDTTKDSVEHVGTNTNTTTPTTKPRALSIHVHGLSDEDSEALVRQMAEMAATAATVATRDATSAPQRANRMARTVSTMPHPEHRNTSPSATRDNQHGQSNPRIDMTASAITIPEAEEAVAAGGGHDAPNWSRTKSYVVLLTATVAYAIIAEILVSTVDAVLENVDIDEKFLGITLFALVPNTTEFLNGISFAMNGNIALSMEIGSAYALQVCLLQIPALVLFSASETAGWFTAPIGHDETLRRTFTLLFPQWDMVTVILCVFLLSYMYGEGKSNYFKGSILILSYLVVVVGFYFAGYSNVESGSGLMILADQTGIGGQYVDVRSGRRIAKTEV